MIDFCSEQTQAASGETALLSVLEFAVITNRVSDTFTSTLLRNKAPGAWLLPLRVADVAVPAGQQRIECLLHRPDDLEKVNPRLNTVRSSRVHQRMRILVVVTHNKQLSAGVFLKDIEKTASHAIPGRSPERLQVGC